MAPIGERNIKFIENIQKLDLCQICAQGVLVHPYLSIIFAKGNNFKFIFLGDESLPNWDLLLRGCAPRRSNSSL